MGLATCRHVVLDDDPAIRQALARLMRAAGLAAQVFASVAEMLEKPQFDDRVCIVVGVSGGEGTLKFEGNYPLSIGGVSLGATISLSKADFVGDVFNLSAPEDIEGVYSGAGAGAALAGGSNCGPGPSASTASRPNR